MAPTDFAARLRAREPLVGFWLQLPSAPAAERIGLLGFDFVVVDVQHGLVDYASCVSVAMGLAAGGGTPLVRVPGNDFAWIGRALDAGAHGVVVPLVNTARQAEAAAGACRYPPRGARSFGPVRSGLRIGPDPETADAQVACIVMIESAEGLANVEQICAVPGVDALFVGPADLSLGLGLPVPQPGVPEHPKLTEALERVLDAAAAASKACGMYCRNGEAAADFLSRGFTFVTAGTDVVLLERAAADALASARAGVRG